MKKFRSIAENPILGSTVLLSFMFMSCSGDNYLQENVSAEGTTSINTTSRVESTTGQQIFKDLFFFQGPFTDSYPALKEHKEKINAYGPSNEIWGEINSFASEVIAYIERKDATYFDKFKTVITSGDNYAITDAIIEASALMEAAAFASPKYGKFFKANDEIMKDPALHDEVISLDLTKEEGRNRLEEIMEAQTGEKTSLIPCIPGAFFCVYYMVAGAVSYVVGAYTAIGVAQVFWKTKYWPKNSAGVTTVETQQYVNDLSLFYRA